jgi:hypothetical protein
MPVRGPASFKGIRLPLQAPDLLIENRHHLCYNTDRLEVTGGLNNKQDLSKRISYGPTETPGHTNRRKKDAYQFHYYRTRTALAHGK